MYIPFDVLAEEMIFNLCFGKRKRAFGDPSWFGTDDLRPDHDRVESSA